MFDTTRHTFWVLECNSTPLGVVNPAIDMSQTVTRASSPHTHFPTPRNSINPKTVPQRHGIIEIYMSSRTHMIHTSVVLAESLRPSSFSRLTTSDPACKYTGPKTCIGTLSARYAGGGSISSLLHVRGGRVAGRGDGRNVPLCQRQMMTMKMMTTMTIAMAA
jgi:hypothetical protein